MCNNIHFLSDIKAYFLVFRLNIKFIYGSRLKKAVP